MITREQIISEARTWLGTPFHHQGRLKNVGVDCIGLVAETAKVCGLFVNDHTNYSHQPSASQIKQALLEHCDKIPFADAQSGDILLFRFEEEPQHVGFLTDIGLLHCAARNKKVVEHSLDGVWRNRLVAAYHIRGVV